MIALKTSFRKAIYTFLKSSASTALSVYHYDISDTDMEPLFSLIDEVETYFDQLSLAFILAFSISTAISAFCYVLSIIFVVLDFRKRVFELRRGIWRFSIPRSDINVNESLNFVGAFISNSVVGFFSIIILYGIFLTPICYSLFWVIIFQNINTIMIFIAPSIAQSILFMIFKKLFTTQHFVTWRL